MVGHMHGGGIQWIDVVIAWWRVARWVLLAQLAWAFAAFVVRHQVG